MELLQVLATFQSGQIRQFVVVNQAVSLPELLNFVMSGIGSFLRMNHNPRPHHVQVDIKMLSCGSGG